MHVDRDTIRHLEQLARIELDDTEAAVFADQLDRIVAFVERLVDVDTTRAHPTPRVEAGVDVGLRDDVVAPGLERGVVMDQAPEAADGYFDVPRVPGRGGG